MNIRRDFYLNKLIKRKNNGLIKVITGIRRCGKSYLLNNLFYHHLLENGVEADHIIRFAFDSADDLYLIGESLIQIEKEKRGADPEKFMAYIRSRIVDDEMYYLLLDDDFRWHSRRRYRNECNHVLYKSLWYDRSEFFHGIGNIYL